MTDVVNSALPEDPNKVSLAVNGKIFGGWKSVRIEIGIDQVCRAFAVSTTYEFPGNESFQQLSPGMIVQVYIGKTLVCTGYITATPTKYDAKGITVEVQGKSYTVDLVDCCPACSADSLVSSGTGAWNGVKGKCSNKVVTPAKKSSNSWQQIEVQQIIADLCKGYKSQVVCDQDIGSKVTNHTVNPGEKIFDSINRLLTKKNLVITDDESGNLVITTAKQTGKQVAVIVGGNKPVSPGITEVSAVSEYALAGQAQFDASQQYSNYIIIGQHKGSDDECGRSVAQDKGEYKSKNIGRYRLLVLKDSGQSSKTDCEKRAKFEAQIRDGKYTKSVHTLRGWRTAAGDLWKTNTLVEVKDFILCIDSKNRLITKVIFTLDNLGTRTSIETVPANSYRREVTNGEEKKVTKKNGQWGEVK
jgi:prophage tail gpP-like protein